ncbi:MAG: hypothetical protein DMD58_07955 [Gemmatimonadetes bacterium]|nr:MAG: hypothetical protein DMD58_07955 [Gemmatimonadota bacterium]
MADLVAPFRGERYAAVERLSSLIAPPYDVIDQAERARYAALAAENIVHVMLPEAPPGGPDGDRYRLAAERLAGWRAKGVLRRDPQPVLYVLAQDFTLPTGERLTRRGVFHARHGDQHRIDLPARAGPRPRARECGGQCFAGKAGCDGRAEWCGNPAVDRA